MDPDVVYPVEDYSAETLAALIAALELSSTREHCIYREAELDDLWRVLDTALAAARRDTRAGADAARLEQLRAFTMEAHDRVGSDEQPQAAAQLMRGALSLAEARA